MIDFLYYLLRHEDDFVSLSRLHASKFKTVSKRLLLNSDDVTKLVLARSSMIQYTVVIIDFEDF